MPNNPESFKLIPHIQTKLATDVKGIANGRRSVSYNLKLTGDGNVSGNPETIKANLMGPGDVTGIISSQIARIEPESGLRGFEPNYFPFIEFVDADFPWRYSLDTKDNKKGTWLSLIALQSEEFEFIEQGGKPLPSILVHNIHASLPNLNQSWATAHAQVNLDESNGAKGTLEADPANGFSRLFCYRKLNPQAKYFLFLVPAYKAGLITGLGSDEAIDSSLAWNQKDATSIILPFYHEAQFTTSAMEDFEELAKRLRGLKADEPNEAGASQHISSAKPGYYPNYSAADASFEKQGSLKQANHKPEAYNTDTDLADQMVSTLNKVISGETGGDNDDEDPLIAFPAYGFRFQQETSVSIDGAKKGTWFDRINLDLKMRQSAAVGSETVRQNQEFFSKLCWDQYESILEANLRLNRLRAASKLAALVANKHFNKLDSDIALKLAEPLQPFVKGGQKGTVAESLRAAGIASSLSGRGNRRIAAKRPMRNQKAPGSRFIPMPRIPGDQTSSIAMVRPQRRLTQSVLVARARLDQNFSKDAAKLMTTNAFKKRVRPKTTVVRTQPIASREYANAMTKVLKDLPI